jgi:hypothetical protein
MSKNAVVLTVFCCQECVFIGPLPNNECPMVERLCFGMCLPNLPTNIHMRHII